MLNEGQRLFHTVRHLRLEQVRGRAVRRLRRVRPDDRVAPKPRVVVRDWVVYGRRRQSLLDGGRFTFLNETRQLTAAADWNNPHWPRLWTYNLHYFDDLNAAGAAARWDDHRVLIARWIDENPAGRGAGWEPYCLSLRIVNWCKWAWQGNDLDAAARHSLAVQARALMGQVEIHLLGNHLLANAKALIFAGSFFAGDEAAQWRRRGLHFLRREMTEQVLADGAHFELSPMYHSLVLEDFLDLLQLARVVPDALSDGVVDDLRRHSAAMLDWLDVATHPDGEIGFFNDAAFGIAEAPGVLAAYGAQFGVAAAAAQPGLRHMGASGLVRLEAGPAVVLADAGPIGPDHLPGHAHADSLSCEVSVFGQRVLVNSGTSHYADGAERLRQRGTAAHNTVAVDGADSSEVWGSFRVARRARPGQTTTTSEDGVQTASGSHDGYRRLPGRVTHGRAWRLDPQGLTVDDVLDGTFTSAAAYWRLHPAVQVASEGPNRFRLGIGDGGAVLTVDGGAARLTSCHWFPEFGKSVPCRLLTVDFAGPRLTTALTWGD